MSAPLVISIPHQLGRAEAVRRLKTGLARAASSVPILSVEQERWQDDRMDFRVRALGQVAAGIVDVAREKQRLEEELERLSGHLRATESRLANEQFVSRAPAEVVAREREKAASLRDQCERLRRKLESLTA